MAVGKQRSDAARISFIAEIDENHIIGGTGYLYCIVPVDENASVAINRVKWDNKTRSEKVTEVLYRSENGEPVLLFANLDGVAYEADTQVIITDSSGNICKWYPSLDADSYLAPCITDEGESLLWDFTEYAWQSASPDLAPLACRRLDRNDSARSGRITKHGHGLVHRNNEGVR